MAFISSMDKEVTFGVNPAFIGALIYYGVVINKPQEKPKIQNNKKSS